MNFWSFYASLIGKPEMGAASHSSVGVWLRVLCYCVTQENRGVCAGVRRLPSRALSSLLQCNLEELDAAAADAPDLLRFEGDDLTVAFYPHVEHAALDAKREGGKKGGRPSKAHPGNLPATKVSDSLNLPAEGLNHSLKDRIGKDRKGEERTGEGRPAPEGAPTPAAEGISFPDSAEEVLRYARSAGMPWTARHATKWFDHMSARGWMLGGHGSIPCRDWRAECRKAQGWVLDAVAREDSAASETGLSPAKKIKAPPDERERQRLAVARRLWPEAPATLRFTDLTPEQRDRVLREIADPKREEAA